MGSTTTTSSFRMPLNPPTHESEILLQALKGSRPSVASGFCVRNVESPIRTSPSRWDRGCVGELITPAQNSLGASPDDRRTNHTLTALVPSLSRAWRRADTPCLEGGTLDTFRSPDPELAIIAPDAVPHALPGLHRRINRNRHVNWEPRRAACRPSVPWGPDRRATTTAALLREIYVDVKKSSKWPAVNPPPMSATMT